MGVPEYRKQPHPVITRCEADRVAKYLAACVAYEIMGEPTTQYTGMLYRRDHHVDAALDERFCAQLPPEIADWSNPHPAARDTAGSPVLTMFALALRAQPDMCKCCKCGKLCFPLVNGANANMRCGRLVCGLCRWGEGLCGCGTMAPPMELNRDVVAAEVTMAQLLEESAKYLDQTTFMQGILALGRP